MRLFLVALFVCCAAASTAARADTYTLSVNAAFADGAATGYITGTYGSVDLSQASVDVVLNGKSYVFNAINRSLSGEYQGIFFFNVLEDTTGDLLALDTPGLYGTLCSLTSYCAVSGSPVLSYIAVRSLGTQEDVVSGYTALASTPEPSGLALLATGTLAIAGVLRRRNA